MNSSSFRNPCRKVFLTFNYLIVHLKVNASERINLIVVCFITGLKVSPKSRHGI